MKSGTSSDLREIGRSKIALTIDVEHLYCEDFEGCMFDLFNFLEKREISTTMFFLGKTALNHPDVLKEAHRRGHEIGCHGLDHMPAGASQPEVFLKKTKESKEIIEKTISQSILGFRSPDFSVTKWLLPSLKTLSFKYDSSLYPCLPIFSWYGSRNAPLYPYHPNMQNPDERDETETFMEFPVAVMPDLRLPAGGGWWLRNLGTNYSLFSLSRLVAKGPGVLYFHPWEFTEKLTYTFDSESFGSAFKPPFIFRKTGRFVFDLIDRISKELAPEFVTIEELMNTLARGG